MALKWDNIGLYMSSLGIISLFIIYTVVFKVIDNGTSGQLVIDTKLSGITWGLFTAVLVAVVGLLLWFEFSTFQNKYLALFLFSWVSYLIANLALLFSCYQVQLAKV